MIIDNFQFLLPYLDFGIKVKAGSRLDITKGFINRSDGSISIWIEKFCGWVLLSDITPYLKPLADFYDINCPALCETDLDISTQLLLVDLCIGKIHYSNLHYSDMREFLRLHIDIFGLIDKDFAIPLK